MSGVDCYECRAGLSVLAQNARLALSTVLYFVLKMSSLLLPFLPLLFPLKTRFKDADGMWLDICLYSLQMEWLQNRIDSFTRLSLSASWPAGNLKVICVNPFEFNRYVDDFRLDETRHMVYKNAKESIGRM